MVSLSKVIKALMLTMMVSACATTIQPIPEKYALDEQLEQVKEIKALRMGQGRHPTFMILGPRRQDDSSGPFDQSDSEGPGEDLRDIINQLNTVTLSESSHHWIKVDNQSLILRTGPGEYHLLILRTPAPHLMFSDGISFMSSINTIKAGLDLVQVGNNMRYVIERIYKISSLEQMYAIKDQLVGKNNKQRE
jgi:hypothetical protein